MNSSKIQLSRMYSDLYEQEMLMERRMLTMDDNKRTIIQIDLAEIKRDMDILYHKIILL